MSDNTNKPHIKIVQNGPYIVTGSVPLTEQTIISERNGTAVRYEENACYPLRETYSLCRCGKSTTMPYCDGSHTHNGFVGRETASREPFSEQADVTEGPELIMEDVQNLCISARFCHLGGNTWDLVENSDDPKLKELAIQGACNCPAGRLVVRDANTGEAIENEYEPSIGVLRDPAAGVSGPLWVRGGIPIESADGTTYEVRNRVTLCRCGKSHNTPFCDATHFAYGFKD
jgi:CDGSH-type Zn-finger protein